MNKKKIIIVGAGIAGLNAGIELLQHGYDVSLYEKNNEVGGLCSGYFIGEYNLDCCLHWLMGTKKNTILNSLWYNNDALNDDVKISNLPNFCTFSHDGIKVTFSRNLDEEEARWKALSPEDKKVITTFFAVVRKLAIVWDITQSENAKGKYTRGSKVLTRANSILKSMRMSRKEYSLKFKHPALRFAIENAMTGYNNMCFFMLVYALFSIGDGDVPFGGAYMMVQRIKNKYLSLGGNLYSNTNVGEIIVENKKATGIRIGEEIIKGDYVISALDPNFTLKNLLKDKYRIKKFDKLNKNVSKYPISSTFNVYYKADTEISYIDIPTCYQIPAIKVGQKEVSALLMRPYYFDTTYKYENNASVFSIFIDQDQDDYDYFVSLKDYKKAKEQIVKDVTDALLFVRPELKGHLTVLTSFGPIELEKRSHASWGALLSYSFTKTLSFYSFSGEVKGIKNFYMASQWNRSIGGTPGAVLSSHKIVNKLLKKERKKD